MISSKKLGNKNNPIILNYIYKASVYYIVHAKPKICFPFRVVSFARRLIYTEALELRHREVILLRRSGKPRPDHFTPEWRIGKRSEDLTEKVTQRSEIILRITWNISELHIQFFCSFCVTFVNKCVWCYNPLHLWEK